MLYLSDEVRHINKLAVIVTDDTENLENIEKMEIANGIIIPIVADFVLSPDVFYGDELTGIYFQTEDEQYGRITFENLDSIKICRGENLPYPDNWKQGQKYPWVYKVENSNWQKERCNYEKENYGS